MIKNDMHYIPALRVTRLAFPIQRAVSTGRVTLLRCASFCSLQPATASGNDPLTRQDVDF